ARERVDAEVDLRKKIDGLELEVVVVDASHRSCGVIAERWMKSTDVWRADDKVTSVAGCNRAERARRRCFGMDEARRARRRSPGEVVFIVGRAEGWAKGKQLPGENTGVMAMRRRDGCDAESRRRERRYDTESRCVDSPTRGERAASSRRLRFRVEIPAACQRNVVETCAVLCLSPAIFRPDRPFRPTLSLSKAAAEFRPDRHRLRRSARGTLAPE